MSAVEVFRFVGCDGKGIAGTHGHSHGEPRGMVQIAHGIGEHVGRYAQTAAFLSGHGLAALGNDHRGMADLPVHCLAGSLDPIGQETIAVERLIGRYVAAGVRRNQCDIYEGGRHGMLNGVDRAEVRAMLLDWIERNR